MSSYKMNEYAQIDVHVCLLHLCSKSLVLLQTHLNRMWLFWTTVHRVWQQTASPHISAAIVRRLSCWMWPVAPDWWHNRWTYKTKSDPFYKIWLLCRSLVCLVNVKTCFLLCTRTFIWGFFFSWFCDLEPQFLFSRFTFSGFDQTDLQLNVRLLNRWRDMDLDILWVLMEARLCWRWPERAGCTRTWSSACWEKGSYLCSGVILLILFMCLLCHRHDRHVYISSILYDCLWSTLLWKDL